MELRIVAKMRFGFNFLVSSIHSAVSQISAKDKEWWSAAHLLPGSLKAWQNIQSYGGCMEGAGVL